jgi:hypothetical protein
MSYLAIILAVSLAIPASTPSADAAGHSDSETVRTLREELVVAQTTIKLLHERLSQLEEQNAELLKKYEDLLAKVAPADQKEEAKPGAAAAPPPEQAPQATNIAQVVRVATEWLQVPPRETAAARQERRTKLHQEVIGKSFAMRATLVNVVRERSGNVSAELLYVSPSSVETTTPARASGFTVVPGSRERVPTHTILIKVRSVNENAAAMQRGASVVVTAVIGNAEFTEGGRRGADDWVSTGGAMPSGKVAITLTAAEGEVR